MRRRYNVDADRIACAGFSDGASACFHLLAHAPEPFCCFFACMGQPLVSRLLGGPTHAANLASRPIWAITGDTDRLYPTSSIEPLIEELKAHGARITWESIADTGHDPRAIAPRWEEMEAFWEKSAGVVPKQAAWQSSAPGLDGRAGWVEILETRPEDPAAKADEGALALTRLPVPQPTPRPRLGVILDTAFTGPGLRIEEVQEKTPAEEAGVFPGDVLIEVDGKAIRNVTDIAILREALERSGASQEDILFVFQRDEERVELRFHPRVLEADKAERKAQGPGVDDPSGAVHAEVVAAQRIEVRTRGVKRFRLHLGPDLVDITRPFQIVVNGTVRHDGTMPLNVAYALTEAWRDGGVVRYLAPFVCVP